MRRIAITQRLVKIKPYQEIREALDVRYNKFIIECGFIPIILPYEVDFENYFSLFQIDGIILTGGNDLSVCRTNELSIIRDNYEKKLLQFCVMNEIPVLGICRGMQVINNYFGGIKKKIQGHAGTNHLISTLNNTKKQKNYFVNSFHDEGITLEGLAKDLEATGLSEEKLVESFRHKKFFIFGQMWHPERKTFDQMSNEFFFNFLNEDFKK